jgi:ubiquinone biosynthesis protein
MPPVTAFTFVVRSMQIALFLPLFLVAFAAVRVFRPMAAPTLLRWYLQTQGAVFVKLGQFLAMRYDVLPPEYCLELSRLLDRLPPVPASWIIGVMERDLGRRVSEAFARFDDQPLASASIAQVHRAVLHDGRVVAVKIMRPDVRRKFEVDFAYMRLLGTVLDDLLFAGSGVSDIMSEVIALTQEELDFRREIGNLHEMRNRMAEDDIDHRAPEVIPELCGDMTITMEFLEGVPVTEILAALETGDAKRLSEWARSRITPRRTARLILRSVLEQTMRHRLFQADPHAANLIVLPGGTLGWVDFGILGWLDERIWLEQYELREAVAAEQIHRAFELVVSMFAPIPKSSVRPFESDVKAHLRDWIRASRNPAASIADKSAGLFFLNIMRASHRAHIRMPVGLTRLFRTIIIADAVVLRLDPSIDWLPITRDFLDDQQRRRAVEMVQYATSVSYAAKLLRLGINFGPAMLKLTQWIDTSIPELGREYKAQLTYLESTILLLLRYARVAILGLTFWSTYRLFFDDAVSFSDRLIVVGLSTATLFVLTKLIRLYR